MKKDKSFSFLISTIAGSSFSNFFKIVKGRRVSARYFPRFLLSGLVSAIIQPFRFYERLRWDARIKNSPYPEKPVFIIGFWRSGTTLMHNLLSQDKQFGYVTTFHSLFPHYILSGQWWLRGLIKALMPDRRPTDSMKLDLDFPQEEEFALGNIHPWSFYNFWFFPEYYAEYRKKYLLLESLSEPELKQWKNYYLWFVKKAMLNTGGKTFLSKSPVHTCRISHMLEMFPHARFIYMQRNPYDVFSSAHRFFSEVIDGIQFHSISKDQLAVNILETMHDLLTVYNNEKSLIPSGQLIEIRFEDFEKDKPGTLENLYKDIDIPGYGNAKESFREYISGIKDFKRNVHHHDEQTIELVNSYLGPLIEQCGYTKL